LVAPYVSNQCLNDALRLELNYLKGDLCSNAGDRSSKAFVHNAYAVLTACRILYSAHHGALVSKAVACEWAMDIIPPAWRAIVECAQINRLKSEGSTTPQTEQDAMRFVEFVTAEVNRILEMSCEPRVGC
ncbi:MAG TPA: aminoglycoside adenylyltransferase domain-containing protein, partial [Bryobacteraceae bacterium]|nr:aminoglycoside adenylyltransferase domain-containing protein [Bryobacteraceae bacterium]